MYKRYRYLFWNLSLQVWDKWTASEISCRLVQVVCDIHHHRQPVCSEFQLLQNNNAADKNNFSQCFINRKICIHHLHYNGYFSEEFGEPIPLPSWVICLQCFGDKQYTFYSHIFFPSETTNRANQSIKGNKMHWSQPQKKIINWPHILFID